MKPTFGARRALIVATSIAALVVVATGAASPQAGPSEIAPPVISGAAIVGRTLTGSPGTWSGVEPITYKFQWLRCQAAAGDDSSTSSCTNISGGTTDHVHHGVIEPRLPPALSGEGQQQARFGTVDVGRHLRGHDGRRKTRELGAAHDLRKRPRRIHTHGRDRILGRRPADHVLVQVASL